jgi:hypothetical protein
MRMHQRFHCWKRLGRPSPHPLPVKNGEREYTAVPLKKKATGTAVHSLSPPLFLACPT